MKNINCFKMKMMIKKAEYSYSWLLCDDSEKKMSEKLVRWLKG